eukprot:GHVR01049231.1.p1 GENE.GHVR01049231.1~~GHVR01049231.1.p1  ORF type:complete len:378 (+),score=112.43 GHVR01049231.1:514-1647(+)
MVGEYFQWSPANNFVMLRSNHNSVVGIREYALDRGATFLPVSQYEVEEGLRLAETSFRQDTHKQTHTHTHKNSRECLFSFPAKDNFSGEIFPLSWVNRLHKVGTFGGVLGDTKEGKCESFRVLVDAAAYVPTMPLNLTDTPIDFLAISFYKMFGYPSGLGALVLKKEKDVLLKKKYFGGGAVVAVCCDIQWCKEKPIGDPHRLEDGTPPFLSIVALRAGLKRLLDIGMDNIKEHVSSLSQHLAIRLRSLKHTNNRPIVLIYNKEYNPTGGIVTINLFNKNGQAIQFDLVTEMAASWGIHVRGGCFCNPGACQDTLGLTTTDVMEAAEGRNSCFDKVSSLLATNIKLYGAVRVSMGYMSTLRDVEAFVTFVSSLRDSD